MPTATNLDVRLGCKVISGECKVTPSEELMTNMRKLMKHPERQQVKITRIVKRWVFPNDRFIQYEPSDESWCRPLGIGSEQTCHEVTTINNAIISGLKPDGSFAFTGNSVTTVTSIIPDPIHQTELFIPRPPPFT